MRAATNQRGRRRNIDLGPPDTRAASQLQTNPRTGLGEWALDFNSDDDETAPTIGTVPYASRLHQGGGGGGGGNSTGSTAGAFACNNNNTGSTAASAIESARLAIGEDQEEDREKAASSFFRKQVGKFIFPHMKYITPSQIQKAKQNTVAFVLFAMGYSEEDNKRKENAAEEWDRNLQHVAAAITTRRCTAISSLRLAYISKFVKI